MSTTDRTVAHTGATPDLMGTLRTDCARPVTLNPVEAAYVRRLLFLELQELRPTAPRRRL